MNIKDKELLITQLYYSNCEYCCSTDELEKNPIPEYEPPLSELIDIINSGESVEPTPLPEPEEEQPEEEQPEEEQPEEEQPEEEQPEEEQPEEEQPEEE